MLGYKKVSVVPSTLFFRIFFKNLAMKPPEDCYLIGAVQLFFYKYIIYDGF